MEPPDALLSPRTSPSLEWGVDTNPLPASNLYFLFTQSVTAIDHGRIGH